MAQQGTYSLFVLGKAPQHNLSFLDAMRELQRAFESGFDSARVARQ
jgi:hypothetical protein